MHGVPPHMRHLIAVSLLGLGLATSPLHAEPARPVPSVRIKAPRVVPPTRAAVLVDYQRVGRELMQLERLRGHRRCAELWPQFKAIQIDAAVKTSDSRVETLEELTELRDRIARLRGIEVSAECLANPLAAACH